MEEVARTLRLRSDRVSETLQAFQDPIRLETPVGDGKTPLGGFLHNYQTPFPDAYVHRQERQKQLDQLLLPLTPREATIIRMRFGIGYDEALSLVEVGEHLKLSRERIRQIEREALNKLRTSETRAIFASIR